jgi:hypothetical protein
MPCSVKWSGVLKPCLDVSYDTLKVYDHSWLPADRLVHTRDATEAKWAEFLRIQVAAQLASLTHNTSGLGKRRSGVASAWVQGF